MEGIIAAFVFLILFPFLMYYIGTLNNRISNLEKEIEKLNEQKEKKNV